MRQTTTEQLARLIAVHEPPCISLYFPTHRQYPEKGYDRIRYQNLLKSIESALLEEYPVRAVRVMLEKFEALSCDDQLWKRSNDGLAIFCSLERFKIFELQHPIRELLVIADSFHMKPLIRIRQSIDFYQDACLNCDRTANGLVLS